MSGQNRCTGTNYYFYSRDFIFLQKEFLYPYTGMVYNCYEKSKKIPVCDKTFGHITCRCQCPCQTLERPDVAVLANFYKKKTQFIKRIIKKLFTPLWVAAASSHYHRDEKAAHIRAFIKFFILKRSKLILSKHITGTHTGVGPYQNL